MNTALLGLLNLLLLVVSILAFPLVLITILDRFIEGTFWFSPLRLAKRRMDQWVNRRTLELELEGHDRYDAKRDATREYIERPAS